MSDLKLEIPAWYQSRGKVFLPCLGRFMLALYVLNPVWALSSNANILHVSQSGSGLDGLSWETAFHDVAEALLSSSSGDQIWVKEGVYDCTLTLRSGVGVFGGFAGNETTSEFHLRDWSLNRTIINLIRSRDHAVDSVNTTDSQLDGIEFRFQERILAAFVYEGFGGRASIDNCTIVDINPQNHGGTLIIPFGIHVRIKNTLMVRKSPTTSGSIIAVGEHFNSVGRLTAENCTFVGEIAHPNFHLFNSAIFTVGGDRGLIPEIHIVNSIAQANQGIPIVAVPMYSRGKFVARHSNLVMDTLSIEEIEMGNINSNPLFIDPDELNFRLQQGSPCIDAGTPVLLASDLEGNPRPVDIPGVGVDGEGAFDMGAYEFQGPFRNSLSDINRDGRVNAEDLCIFLNDWGKVSGP